MSILRHPFLVFVLSLLVLWPSALLGVYFRKRGRKLEENEHEDFRLVLAATLTLLGLIIGFSFSMAISRYDLRKQYEAEEANSIGTEYQRADLLPPAEAATIKTLLKRYLDLRIQFYDTHNDQAELHQVAKERVEVQEQLWSTVASVKPSATVALAVSGMNSVIDNQGYAQAAWRNRIPVAAWALMGAIAVCCSLLIGFSARRAEAKATFFLILPIVVSISFLLIADIDSPRGGIIRVRPNNLVSLSESLHPQ